MNILLPSKDPLGQAALDFLDTGKSRDILVQSDIAEDDTIASAWLFRAFEDMPAVERQALELCRGRVLDVGAGAGSHSLWLQKKKLDVIAVELSHLCCRAMELRGVKQILNKDILQTVGSWDTILFMMNGLGIGGSLAGVWGLLAHCKSLLAPGGQILFDSTDIRHLYADADDAAAGGAVESDTDDAAGEASGELMYTMSYRGCVSDPFPWVFLDPERMPEVIHGLGLKFECLSHDAASGAWLGRLTVAEAGA